MKNTEAKTRRTAAMIFRVLEDRLEAEKTELANCLNDVALLEVRIALLRDLINDADANGKKEGENGD